MTRKRQTSYLLGLSCGLMVLCACLFCCRGFRGDRRRKPRGTFAKRTPQAYPAYLHQKSLAKRFGKALKPLSFIALFKPSGA